ncbi:MAG: GspE/PulE family protein [Selenomonadaceae bacterium]|uniref:GspE/PulE family protein n=1 Tax=Selenomonas bovis TaxID=416586 RepID=UPI0004E20B7B|nr:GspE/PulE family protein [Selenomonas bovis]MCI6752181.1 GspE/PulE family protein [Selenomonas bovis]MDY6273136.1 GspE/PulE family protein [Selenomonadaceae bacterium]MDY6299386.1 GspE/PulE family protein [Selenomonadaceae bacterium]
MAERQAELFHQLVQQVLREVGLQRASMRAGGPAAARALPAVSAVERLVDFTLGEALAEGASDLHFEPQTGGVRIRVRVDGLLQVRHEPFPKRVYAVFLSRVKVLAGLVLNEQRRPQDGHFSFAREGRAADVRVATMPTVEGECLVLRLLAHGGEVRRVGELGFTAENEAALRALCRAPSGFVVFAGPMGSGKTTSLYAVLAELQSAQGSIVTLDDPVEYRLDGVTQVPIREAGGLSFAEALRHVLRLDADTIVVGEMRDDVTAELSLQAALTGHRVFSTLHTEDACSAVYRLLEMGLAPYLLAATLKGVVAQRLVRRVCPACCEAAALSVEEALMLGDEGLAGRAVRRGAGCAACHGTGYRGRLALQEVLVLDDVLRRALLRGTSLTELRTLAARSGRQSLRADGRRKVLAGLTTAAEVRRVLYG